MARFHTLLVWQRADELLRLTYESMNFVRGENGLREQMKRSAVSVVSNISEGSERGTEREFRQFLVIARGSAAELYAQWHVVRPCGLVDDAACGQALSLADQCLRMLTGFIARLTK
jgi:four helix bundle protein